MAIDFKCFNCGQPLNALFAGQQVSCDQCGAVNISAESVGLAVTVPQPAPLPVEPSIEPAILAAAPEPMVPLTPLETVVPAALPPQAPPLPQAAPPPPAAAPVLAAAGSAGFAGGGAPPPSAGPAAAGGYPQASGASYNAPPKRGGGAGCPIACCCGGLVGLGALVGLIGVVVLIAKGVGGVSYIKPVMVAEGVVLTDFHTFATDASSAAVLSGKFNQDDLVGASSALERMAKLSAEVRHSAEAANKVVDARKPPSQAKELVLRVSDLNGVLLDGLNDLEPQLDYLHFVVDSLKDAKGSMNSVEGQSPTNVKEIIHILTEARKFIKDVHDKLMVKSAPPGCEKLHTDTLGALEEMSSVMSEMTTALNDGDYGRAERLANSAENRINTAVAKFQGAYTEWGHSASRELETFAAEVTPRIEKYGEEQKKLAEALKIPLGPGAGETDSKGKGGMDEKFGDDDGK